MRSPDMDRKLEMMLQSVDDVISVRPGCHYLHRALIAPTSHHITTITSNIKWSNIIKSGPEMWSKFQLFLQLWRTAANPTTATRGAINQDRSYTCVLCWTGWVHSWRGPSLLNSWRGGTCSTRWGGGACPLLPSSSCWLRLDLTSFPPF